MGFLVQFTICATAIFLTVDKSISTMIKASNCVRYRVQFIKFNNLLCGLSLKYYKLSYMILIQAKSVRLAVDEQH